MTNDYEALVVRWRELGQTLGVTDDKAVRELHQAYTEKHRHYHTLEHLGECLDLAHQYRAQIGESWPLLELALWFHDAVYDVLSSRNEEKSADWALRFLARGRRAAQEQTLVRALILVTRHSAAPASPLEEWMIDIDLAILGAASERYQAYERQVRQEYSQVPLLLYRSKRSEILQGFLDREVIYNTQDLRQKREEQARRNLLWSLEHLKGKG